MNSNFDKEIKSIMKNEKFDIPNNLKNEIKTILESLPEDNDGLKKDKTIKYKTKIVLIASVITLLIATTAFASMPELLKMTQNFIKNFNKIDNINITSKQQEYEKYNSPANYTSKSNGISVTIDNIAVDGNFLLITSTITSPKKIIDIVTDSTLYKQVLNRPYKKDYTDFIFALSPYYLFKIDGKDYGIFDKPEWEDYILNDYSFVTVQKYIIPVDTPDIFKLSLSANNVCDVQGEWNFDIVIDKDVVNEDSATVTPNISAEVTSIVKGVEYKHNITIDKLSISPFGGQISLSEKGDEIFRDFTLRDANGNYYHVLNNTVKFSSINEMNKNSYEFIFTSRIEDIEEIELVPILTYGTPVEKKVMLEEDIISTDIKLSDIGGYKVDNIDINENEIKIILKPYGVILQYRSIINGAFGFLDKGGSKEINKLITLEEVKYDKSTGNATITGYLNDNTSDKLLEQIGGVWYIEMPNMKLNENEAIKILLK